MQFTQLFTLPSGLVDTYVRYILRGNAGKASHGNPGVTDCPITVVTRMITAATRSYSLCP